MVQGVQPLITKSDHLITVITATSRRLSTKKPETLSWRRFLAFLGLSAWLTQNVCGTIVFTRVN